MITMAEKRAGKSHGVILPTSDGQNPVPYLQPTTKLERKRIKRIKRIKKFNYLSCPLYNGGMKIELSQ